jgi:hypothetical protein
VVVVHVDGFDHFVDEDASFAFRCGLPERIHVDLGEVGGDLVEVVGDVGCSLLLGCLLVVGRSHRVDLCAEPSLFLGEQVGCDLVGIVQAQQLAPFLEQRRKRDGRGWRRRATPLAGPPLAGFQLLADRFSELFVRADQLQPEQCRTMQTTSRPAGERTAGATVATAVVDVTGAVVLDVHPLAASTAAHTARQQITTTTPSRHSASECGGELVGGDDRFVFARIPLAVQEHFAEVDARVQDLAHERVVDARCSCDVTLACAVASQLENPTHDRGHVVRDEVAVDEVVAGLGSVDPLAFPDGLLHAHADVLGELFSVELCERTEHRIEHATRRR